MGKTALRPIQVSDDKHKEPVNLLPGDEVPSWAEPLIKPEYMDDDKRPVAAGSDLFVDHTYPQMVRAAEKLDIDVDPSWSSEQIAAVVRAKLFDDEYEENLGEDEEDERDETAVDTMTALFGETNKSGNVNAPDQGQIQEKPTAKPSSSKATSGGTDS